MSEPAMLSWLRRTFGWFERRWIHDPGERDRSTHRVRSRLGLRRPDEHAPMNPEDAAVAAKEPTVGR